MNISIKSLILTIALSLSYMTSYCIDPKLQQENAAAQRLAIRANAHIERQVRNRWYELLSEPQIRVLITAEQSNRALAEISRLNLSPAIMASLHNDALRAQEAAVRVINNALGTNSQSASEESKTT